MQPIAEKCDMRRLPRQRARKWAVKDPAKVEAMRSLRETFDLIPITELAKRWDVHVRTVRRLHERGEGPPRVLHGHRKKYSLREVVAWEEAQRSAGKRIPGEKALGTIGADQDGVHDPYTS